MHAPFAAIKPGMRDTDVAAVAVHYNQPVHGTENGIYLSCASTSTQHLLRNSASATCPDRTIKKGA